MSGSKSPETPQSRELSGSEVLALLARGNRRFARGQPTHRDPLAQVAATAGGQSPLAVVLACMDSRIATEMIFDLGIGDLFSVRVAGNLATTECLGSMEFGCVVSGAKLALVLGHTRCGAVTAAIDHVAQGGTAAPTGLQHLDVIVEALAGSVHAETGTRAARDGGNDAFVRSVALVNVRRTMAEIRERSPALRERIDRGEVLLAGGLYDVTTGRVEFFDGAGQALDPGSPPPGEAGS